MAVANENYVPGFESFTETLLTVSIFIVFLLAVAAGLSLLTCFCNVFCYVFNNVDKPRTKTATRAVPSGKAAQLFYDPCSRDTVQRSETTYHYEYEVGRGQNTPS